MVCAVEKSGMQRGFLGGQEDANVGKVLENDNSFVTGPHLLIDGRGPCMTVKS